MEIERLEPRISRGLLRKPLVLPYNFSTICLINTEQCYVTWPRWHELKLNSILIVAQYSLNSCTLRYFITLLTIIFCRLKVIYNQLKKPATSFFIRQPPLHQTSMCEEIQIDRIIRDHIFHLLYDITILFKIYYT